MNKGREPLYFHPSCTKDYWALPESVQDDAGHNLDRVQQGLQPQISFDALRGLGSGVMELRIREDSDTYRVVYHLPRRVCSEVLRGYIRPRRLQEEISHGFEAPEKHRGADSPAIRGCTTDE